ncbi:MAG TPA: glycosyltransferase family 4 protein [Planctomycetota bacterium]
MKRIVYVVNNASFFVSHRLELGKAARAEGWDVHVAAPEPDAPARAALRGFDLHVVRMKRAHGRPWSEPLTLWDLVRLYRCLRPDVVHHVGLKPAIYGTLAARIAGVRRIVNAITGLGYLFIAEGLLASIARGMVKLALKGLFRDSRCVTIFQNPTDYEMFIRGGLSRRETSVMIKGAGVDLTRFSRAEEVEGLPVVLFIGRLLWHKGAGEFVGAARRLRNAPTRARFVLIGDLDVGNPAGVPRDVVEGWVREGVVEWWGYREDVPDLMRKAHIVCLPSYREGAPKVLLEAAACGRPVVTTDCPGCRDVVVHGENGFVVPVANDAALASALDVLIQDPKLRRDMGVRGRAMAEAEFSLERVVPRTLSLYEPRLS